MLLLKMLLSNVNTVTKIMSVKILFYDIMT